MDDSPLDALLARLPTLDPEQVRVLHATWTGGDVERRTSAWQHGKRLLAERGLERAYRDASDVVRRWTSDHTLVPTRTTAITFGLVPSFIEQDWLELRIAAAPPLLDAILGTLVGDGLDEGERDELLAPWLEATSRPTPVTDEWSTLDVPDPQADDDRR